MTNEDCDTFSQADMTKLLVFAVVQTFLLNELKKPEQQDCPGFSLELLKSFFKRFELFFQPFGKTISELSKVFFNIGNFRSPCF